MYLRGPAADQYEDTDMATLHTSDGYVLHQPWFCGRARKNCVVLWVVPSYVHAGHHVELPRIKLQDSASLKEGLKFPVHCRHLRFESTGSFSSGPVDP